MPIIIIFKNGLNVIVDGQRINEKEWRRGRILKKTAMNGHDILISTEAVAIVEHVPDEEYQRRIKEIKHQKEKEVEQQESRIAKPVFVIPKKLN